MTSQLQLRSFLKKILFYSVEFFKNSNSFSTKSNIVGINIKV